MFKIENVSKGENIIKYTFCDLCWKKCKIAINHALTYQNLKILFNLMINMNIFFEFMSMILKNHMFKVDFSRLKIVSRIFLLFGLPKETK
jgi:hypothetical protein